MLRQVGGAELEGEVQRVQRRPNGMLWFSLTDGEATLSCKVFARDAARIEHTPRDGDLVRVRVDRPDFYAAQGSLSLIVSAIRLAGEGELLRRRAALVAQLGREGLCDPARRRPLPAFPRAVGVIAGANSDGMSDVIRALTDRWPAVHVITCASTVQGKAAPGHIIDALARLGEHPLVDVIVLARGGGSVQDLACFDDERLCRAVFACGVPVVCAIGHTDNVPVCNHVSWSAFTPSRSAEMVVPSAAALRQHLTAVSHTLAAVPAQILGLARHLEAVAAQMDCAQAIAIRRAAVGQEGQRLSGAPRRLSAACEGMTVTGASLDRSAGRIGELARELRHTGIRVSEGIRRQTADHRRDYGRASERLMREARAGLARHQGRLGELLQRQGGLLVERTRRRIEDSRRGLVHQAEVIVARDFRPRGWLLASRGGVPVRSSAELARGDVVELHLQDGRVGAVIHSTDRSEERHGRDSG